MEWVFFKEFVTISMREQLKTWITSLQEENINVFT